MKVIVPSCKEENIISCVENIFKHEEQLGRENIIVIDDGAGTEVAKKRLAGITWLSGVKPFVFARNVNLGIKDANDDVVLLNDDIELLTSNGLSNLCKHKENGLVFPHVVGRYTGRGSFACVLIPKHTQERVGLLDERFIFYGFEDDDYCMRVVDAGLPIYRCWPDECTVKHLPAENSTFHDPANKKYVGDNQMIFNNKWPEEIGIPLQEIVHNI